MLETSSFHGAIVIGQGYIRVSTVQKRVETVRLTERYELYSKYRRKTRQLRIVGKKPS